ncbi:MAG TPA: dihydropteroate synthase [Tepidisphaeraceae bacterium]|jgi:dihydropteroate synthase|nr:dihydropteroate synthase [Tepidisphaeraceae bacterium]
MTADEFNLWLGDGKRRPLVMGVLNVTPDSFSDGGKFFDAHAAAREAAAMESAGADLIDIGGESTRPGSQPVSPEQQLERILPVIRAIRNVSPITLSIDTMRAAVADAALDAGANLVNDISAGRDDAEMYPLVARRKVPIVLMHMQGMPATMQDHPTYQNVAVEVELFLRERMTLAISAGIKRRNILVDPGIGFGKTTEHNLTLLRGLKGLRRLGRPVVIGTSRKGFIGKIIGEPDPMHRQFGTAATIAWALANGAAIVRVHDVGPMVQVTKMVRAMMEGAGAEKPE